MNERYAVLEWEAGIDDVANIIGKDLDKELADVLVRIAPEHLHREVRTMDELAGIKNRR